MDDRVAVVWRNAYCIDTQLVLDILLFGFFIIKLLKNSKSYLANFMINIIEWNVKKVLGVGRHPHRVWPCSGTVTMKEQVVSVNTNIHAQCPRRNLTVCLISRGNAFECDKYTPDGYSVKK
jgi:hypothetical protein